MNSVTLLSQFHTSVKQQRQLYSNALSKYREGGAEADAHLRDAMRIAYNFADDAIKVLELLVSVADLKAVLLWSTIKEQPSLDQEPEKAVFGTLSRDNQRGAKPRIP